MSRPPKESLDRLDSGDIPLDRDNRGGRFGEQTELARDFFPGNSHGEGLLAAPVKRRGFFLLALTCKLFI